MKTLRDHLVETVGHLVISGHEQSTLVEGLKEENSSLRQWKISALKLLKSAAKNHNDPVFCDAVENMLLDTHGNVPSE